MNDARDEIKARISIEDLAGEYLELKRTGRNFKALSPWTNERTPSFIISPDKQIWHDFSSGKGGDIFGFIMEVEGMTFREALEFLIKERQVKAVGHETFDTDAGIPAAEHGLVNEYYLLEQDIYQVEVLNNLDQVPATGALISVSFPHWEQATGSPVRAIAILP